MLRKCLGGGIILQFAEGKPDFYPIPASKLQQYSTFPISASGPDGQLLANVSQHVPDLEGGTVMKSISKRRVDMYRLSQLGFNVDKEVVIEAPRGGTQTKPA